MASSARSLCVNTWTALSLWMISIFIICQPTRSSRFLTILYSYMCVMVRTVKSWNGLSIINIAGEELTDQELRNAVYAGSWTSDAKRYFSLRPAVQPVRWLVII